jgi:hypothetical protein
MNRDDGQHPPEENSAGGELDRAGLAVAIDDGAKEHDAEPRPSGYRYNPWSIPPWYRPSAEDEVIAFFRKKDEAVLNVNRTQIASYNAASTVRQAFLRLERAGIVTCSAGREMWPGGPKDDDLWQLRSYLPRYTVQVTGPAGAIADTVACMSWLEVVCAVHPVLTTLPPTWAAAFDLWRPPGVSANAGAQALCRSLTAGKVRCDRTGRFAITAVPPGADELTITVTKTPVREQS